MPGRDRTEEPPADAALVRRVTERDESALAELYDRYAGLVYSVAWRVLGDAGAAEEVLQDIFYQLWRNAARFDPARGSLPGWLLVSARNRAISLLRGRPSLEFLSEDLPGNHAVHFPFELETGAERRQMMERVRGQLDGLPAPQRQALELAYFEGLTHSEIAERTGEPLGTVKSRLRAAIDSLKRTFAP